MLYNTAIYSWERAKNPGYYQIYRIISESQQKEPEIYIAAENIKMVGYGALMVKRSDDTYSLYASPRIREDSAIKYGALRSFIEGILEFHVKGRMLVYKTEEGWFFLSFYRDFWNIDNNDILERRRRILPKFMDASGDVRALKSMATCGDNLTTCIAYTNQKIFILFEGERFCSEDVPKYVYDDEGHQYLNLVPLPGKFIKINRYEPVEGRAYSIKIYPSSEDEFYIGSLLSIQECKQPEVLYTEIVNQWKAERGRYLAVANKLGEQALIYVRDGYRPRAITEWSKKNIVMRYQILSQTYFALVEGDKITEIFDDIN